MCIYKQLANITPSMPPQPAIMPLLLMILPMLLNALHLPATATTTPNIDISMYHNSTQIEQQLRVMAEGNKDRWGLRRCQRGGESYGVLDIRGRGTAGGNGSKGTTGKEEGKSKKLQAILLCNVHARQLFASEVCLQFIRKLAHPSPSLLDSINFRIFYIANQMRDAAMYGQYCQRTDRNDVDLNRNFPTGFKGQTKGDETNSGPKPISEPLSQCLQDEVDRLKPEIFLDVHTGQFSMYYDESTGVKTDTDRGQKQIMETIVREVCGNCRFRAQGSEGVIFYDMKKRKGVKWANLFEVFGGYNQNLGQLENCFTIFNPKGKRAYGFYLERGARMLEKYFGEIVKVEELMKEEAKGTKGEVKLNEKVILRKILI